jgi:Acetyltransferase (GNAT) domain
MYHTCSSLVHLRHSEIDKAEWDRLITQSAQSHLYALSWYLDIISPQWEGLVWQKEGVYQAVMPLPICRKWAQKYIHQPLFCQQLGIFGAENEDSFELMSLFCEKLLQTYGYVPAYSFHSGNRAGLDAWLASKENKLQNRLKINYLKTHHIDLSADYSLLRSRYNADREANLRKAEKRFYRIETSDSIQPLIQLFRKSTENRIQGGVSSEAYLILEKLVNSLKEKNLSKIYYVLNEAGQIESGALFTFFGQRIVYLFNAAALEFRKNNGRTLLIDKILREYAGSSYIFDFESAQKAEIAYFYRSFGAKEVFFPRINWNNLPFWIEWLRQKKGKWNITKE